MARKRRLRTKPPAPPGSALLLEFLEKHDISYAKAAAALHVSRVSVYQWAAGMNRPDDTNRHALAAWTSGAVPADSWRTEGELPKDVAPFSPTGTEG